MLHLVLAVLTLVLVLYVLPLMLLGAPEGPGTLLVLSVVLKQWYTLSYSDMNWPRLVHEPNPCVCPPVPLLPLSVAVLLKQVHSLSHSQSHSYPQECG